MESLIFYSRDYRLYMRCLGPIEEKCKEGMDTLLSYDGGLRTYLLKMEYICGDAKNGKFLNIVGLWN